MRRMRSWKSERGTCFARGGVSVMLPSWEMGLPIWNLRFSILPSILRFLVEAFQQGVGSGELGVAAKQFFQDFFRFGRLPGLKQSIGQGESLLKMGRIEFDGRFKFLDGPIQLVE